ncbi:hypothetical protein RBH26_19920 [Natronolimnohabitans sp. A-GB9]|uniref:hypothetical protein n=1 Tax=Natronolimnohabitans sp. A-GB9 TaxID=3069757 RepID=UPI0027B52E6A|nr:hypothetical protein [Natronolimnohabitans sp. A-GB9]MDQ2052714.1 hypothetical protein [Natronolimnohabitans sp. A-GB9]
MSNGGNGTQEPTGASSPFGGDEVMPFEKQRRAHRFLTQETRYHIVQAILGHPAHLATLDELEYLVPKNRSTIREHLDRLAEKHIIDKYVYDGDEAGQYDPREFWGPTSYGITLLDEYGYLRYVPVLRALQDNLHLTEKIERHRNAPRPTLPTDVDRAFTAPELEDETKEAVDSALAARRRGQLFDAPLIEPDSDAETNGDAERPLDELF